MSRRVLDQAIPAAEGSSALLSRVSRPIVFVPLIGLIVLLVWAARADVPRLNGGEIRGDQATYISMAFSLAKDGDLKYRPEDYRRFKQLYGIGPEGIFLKRSYDLEFHPRLGWPLIETTKQAIPTALELDYGKSFAYAVLAAPFAATLGLGGLLTLNILLLAICAACAIAFARARLGAVTGTLIGIVFLGASVVPVYGVWLTPEVFNFTLVFVAYFLWLYKFVAPQDAAAGWRSPRLDWVAALLLGIATFSKPTHVLLIGPIVLDALVRRRWKYVGIIAVLFTAGSAGLYGVNALVSGESNYQGGAVNDRKYFVSHFPFDGTTNFDDSSAGSSMATNEANDPNDKDIFAPSYLFRMLRFNSWYFLAGRDAGLLPYFFPGLLIFLWWFSRWRHAAIWQWTTAAALGGSILMLLVYTPDSWNGGGGPIGNRYFLSLYPTMFFLLPATFGLTASVVALVVGLTFVGPILIHPFTASAVVWVNPERWPLRLLPVELTIMNQLPVALKHERNRIMVSRDPEVFLYYMDGNTYYQEKDGFWVAPGTADIVIRTEHPLSVLDLRISSPVPNNVEVSIGGRSSHVTLTNSADQSVQLRPEPGVYTYKSYQLVLRVKTTNGFYPRDFDPKSADTRHLGAYIRPTYRVRPITAP